MATKHDLAELEARLANRLERTSFLGNIALALPVPAIGFGAARLV